AARQFPRALDLAAAPGTVTHERHQRPAAAQVRAVVGVTAVRIVAVGFHLEARAVAPRAVLPVQLRAAMAARAGGRVVGHEALDRLLAAAPGTGLHRLRYGPRAVPAFEARVERLAVLALELAEQHLLPQRRILAAVLLARRLLFLRGAVAQTLELRVHD